MALNIKSNLIKKCRINKFNYLIIIVSIIFSIFSCQISPDIDKDVVTSNSSYRAEADEDDPKAILGYLKENGFVIQDKNSPNVKSQGRDKIKKMSEAKKIVALLKSLENSTSEGIVRQVKTKNGRSAFIACEDAGLYYITRALNAGISGIDVRYQRNSQGMITDISSFASGFTVGWAWEQLGSNIFGNGKSEFCIDGILILGMEVEGMPLSYRQAISLRIRLDGCSVRVQEKFGHC